MGDPERTDPGVKELLRALAKAPDARDAPAVAFDSTPSGGKRVRQVPAEPRLAEGLIIGERFRIGPRLGAGGMGEVYRAHDLRLDRAVAIKVLTTALDDERRRRFEHEARAVGALNHPNVCVMHDVGQHDGTPYLVLELLDGETLRARIDRGAIPCVDAIAMALQIADGLAATHERGVVHRDLKPENLFVTVDGRVKILDFGLAKLIDHEVESLTDEGRVLGTVRYMSPEHLRGDTVDARSDVFALGVILLEMVTGRPAFAGRTPHETVTAILRDEPELRSGIVIPPALARVIKHCLDKRSHRRFQSARDFAFALQALRPDELAPRRSRRWVLVALGVFAAATIAAIAAMIVIRRDAPAPAMADPPATTALSYTRLTFPRGNVSAARFAPHGSVVYSAAWDGEASQIYTASVGVHEARSLGVSDADVLAVSPAGELVLKTKIRARSGFAFWSIGTLARVHLAGGAPRELVGDVSEADFSPSGELVVVRVVDDRFQLEWPAGTVIYRTTGWLGQVRVSPSGDVVAVADHPALEDDGGTVALIDRHGTKRAITEHYQSLQGLAWNGDEVWCTAARTGATRELLAASRGGAVRSITSAPTTLRIHDVSANGRVLLSREEIRSRTFVGQTSADASAEQELSWLDGTAIVGISGDGRKIVFTESWDGGGSGYASYVRDTDGGPAIRVGGGAALAISPDGAFVVNVDIVTRQAMLTPTGAGTPRPLLATPEGHRLSHGRFLHDGQRVFAITEERTGLLVSLRDGSVTRSVTLPIEGMQQFEVSPDDRFLASRGPDHRVQLFPLDGTPPRAVAGADPGMRPIAFSRGGNALLVARHRELPMQIFEVDLASGARTAWRTIAPADRTGVAAGILDARVSDDGRVYGYSYLQLLSTLYEARVPDGHAGSMPR